MRWLSFIGLLLLAGASTWLLKTLDRDMLIEDSAAVRNSSDYSMGNFITQTMNNKGQIKYHLQAKGLIHYPSSNTQLKQPYFVFYAEGRPSWYALAEKGEVTPNGDKIFLQGKCSIKHYNKEGALQAEIISSDIFIEPEKRYAETKQPAKINSPLGVTETVGMRLMINERKIDLLSRVRGSYIVDRSEYDKPTQVPSEKISVAK